MMGIKTAIYNKSSKVFGQTKLTFNKKYIRNSTRSEYRNVDVQNKLLRWHVPHC